MIRPPEHVLGQPTAILLLSAALHRGRVSTAYGFFGPEGVGRGLVAAWFAQALLCEAEDPIPCGRCAGCHLAQQRNHPDLLWIEPTFSHQGKLLTVNEANAQNLQRRAPPQIRLEQVQGILTFVARRPLRKTGSVVVLEGSETLAEPAANALLKTLEEPGHAVLILIATSPTALLPTLVSRCQRIPFQRLSAAQMGQILAQQEMPPLLLSMAQGSPGLALAGLEQWQQIPADLRQRILTWPSSLSEALSLGRQIAKTLDVPAQLWLVEYLQHHYWHQGQPERVQQLETARRQLLSFVQPQLAWEMTLAS